MNNYLKGARCGGLIYTVALIIFWVVAVIGRAILSAFNASNGVVYAIYPLFSCVVFLGVTAFCSKKFGYGANVKKFSPLSLLYAVMIAAGMFFGLGFINDRFVSLIEKAGGFVARSDIAVDTPLKYIVYSLTLCLAPAVAEELFFRGALLKSLSKTGVITSALVSALCFSLYHGSAAQLVYQFIYGVLLAVLTFSAKSVIPAIIAHFINNFAVISATFFGWEIDFNGILPRALGAFCLAVFTWVIIMSFIVPFIKTKKQAKNEEEKDKALRFFIPFGIIGVLIAVTMIVLSVIPA